MLLRIWLLVLLFGSAVLLVRAANEEEEEALFHHEAASTLKDRGGYQSSLLSGGNNKISGSNDGLDGHLASGDGNGDGDGSGSAADIASRIGIGLKNRSVNLGSRFAGTKYSRSASSNVIRSRKDNWYRKNFVNQVDTILRVVRKKVNVHKHITYERPLTVDNIKVHQQTHYVSNVYPELKKLKIKEYGAVVQPAKLLTIERSASANRRNVNHPAKVSYSSQYVNIGTRVARTRFLGVRRLGGNDHGNRLGNGLAGLDNGNGLSLTGGNGFDLESLWFSNGNEDKGSGGGNGYQLNNRAADVVPREATIPDEHIVDDTTF